MNNKISRLEKFLWNLYKIYESLGDISEILPRNMYDVVYPECKKLRNIWGKRREQRKLQNLIYYLKRKGLIKEIGGKGKRAWLLTENGEKKSLAIESKLKNYKKRKDGKLIMVIFDIPEKFKSKREYFRVKLKFLGFKMLQKSIWISPLDVLKEINNFSENNFLSRYIKTFIIEEI